MKKRWKKKEIYDILNKKQTWGTQMRYIGNKEKILNEIEEVIIKNNLEENCNRFCDAFSGTSTVGEFFKDKFQITANDNLYLSYVISNAKLNTPDGKYKELGLDPFEYFNNTEEELKGFIYKNYSPGGSAGRMYFSEENAKKIDFIRWKIEEWKEKQKINDSEYYFLIASLLESVSKVANIAGVYGAYLKKWDPRAIKKMKFIPVEIKKENARFHNHIYNEKIENFIDQIEGDILYLDPPYTKNQYSVQYHLLETIAKYDNPTIKGITGARDTSNQTSAFSKPGEVQIQFERIIAKAKFRYIIVSYSSAGIMSKEYIESVLKRYGIEETYQFKKFTYRKYLNHKTQKEGEHFEYIFFIEKKEPQRINYYSPLNYMGGKSEMMDFIKEHSPQNINRVVDLFGGGFNVGINYNVPEIIYNDCNYKVKELIKMFKDVDTLEIYKYLTTMIKKYKLEKEKKEPYIKLREIYNRPEPPIRDPKLLYLLILYGFQQQIRFNSKLEFNNPVGQSGFNDKIFEKLVSFSREIKEKNVIFKSEDFENLESYVDEETFFYCDPPYLITLGSYNDGKRGFNGWSEDDERRLLNFLTRIHNNGGRFMLSNVLEHKGKTNEILKNWREENQFNLIEYKGKSRRKEIIIINY